MGFAFGEGRVKTVNYRGDRVRLEVFRSTLPPFSVAIKILGSERIDDMRNKLDELWEKIEDVRRRHGLDNAKVGVEDDGRCVATYIDCDYEGCTTYSRVCDKRVCDELLPIEEEYQRLKREMKEYMREVSLYIYTVITDGGLE